jgi:phenylalanyl-tRNA synthetase beta chain
MNILIPHTWLLEHLETEATPQKLQELLSLSGPSVERIYDKSGESVYDIEVTTNRVDSMSVRGIAREAAVILAQAGVAATLKPTQLPQIGSVTGEKLPLPKIINNPALCKRITCVILDNVQHTATPSEMGSRLQQIEQNIHDSVIDITNYITHELGHPCHAFDYDKIMSFGGVIKVVEATPGKKFKTLDGVKYETIGGEVVFENESGEIIDLPAIKGTENTAIDTNTKRVLLWIESIDHEKVRFASMKHAIRTVAAQLNEKRVDPYLASAVLARGVELYQSLCHAKVASEVYDDFPGAKSQEKVTVPDSTFKRYLGVEIPTAEITSILEKLGCEVSFDDTKKLFTVQPPTFRPDIEIGADVVEEIARIYGYHNLPSTLMDTPIPTTKPTNTRFDFEHACKVFLAHVSWQEVYTYSLVSETLAHESGYELSDHLKLQNPLTDDRVYLRRSLVPSLVEVLNNNSQRPTLSVFEIAHAYHPQAGALPIEELHLTLVGQKPYREVRGAFEALLKQFYLTGVTIEEQNGDQDTQPHSNTQPSQSTQHAAIKVTTEKEAVQIGSVHVLKNNRVVFDLLLSKLLPLVKTHPTYQPLPKAESLKQDFTFVLPEKTAIGKVIEMISSVSPLVVSVDLADQYKQNYTFAVTYLDPQNSLSSDEVEPIRQKIITVVAEKAQGNLVGA